ncbi:MAG: O-antigen ligase family protein [Phycisphaerae bacterium]|nr:O-antigen ligase family protein [Phycisphaerae bacterium]
MEILKDPITIVLIGLFMVSLTIVMRPRRHPDLLLLILAVVLFALPRAGIMVPSFGVPLPLSHIILMVIMVEWLLVRHNRFHEGAVYARYFIIYAAVTAFGLAGGIILGSKYEVALMELFFYMFMMGIFFYASEAFCQPRHFIKFIRIVLVISVLVSLYGISQRYFGSGVLVQYITYNSDSSLARSYLELDDLSLRRVLSSYGDPNVLASQLIVFFGITLSLLVSQKIPYRTRLVSFGILIINSTCMVLTGSRAGMICMVLVVIIVFSWRKRWVLLGIPALAIIGLFMSSQLIEETVMNRFHGVVSSDDVRAQFPTMAMKLIQVVPFGSGLGRTVSLEVNEMDWDFKVHSAPNIWVGFNSFWLNLFCRLGLPGVVSFLVLLFVLLRHIWRQIKRVQDVQVKAILIGGVAGLICQGVIWMANNTYMLPGGGLNFWFMMGMMVAGSRAYAMPCPYPQMLVPMPGYFPDRNFVPA